MNKKLNNLRKEIDKIDDQIASLIISRQEVSKLIGLTKKESNIAILNSQREEELIKELVEKNPKLNKKFIHKLWTEIMSNSRDLQ